MVDVERLLEEAHAFVDEVWEDVVADIDWLVQVDSVEDKDHAEPGAPFGPGPHEALRRALAIAERLGLATRDCEGYVGIADLEGQSDRCLATIAHADIVPVGNGWDYDPLRITRKDGYLLGRGAIDDKGPLVLSLYAAHFFARQVARTGERLPLTLRCIVGSNEETGMEDVEYYLDHFPQPEFCFTPDAVFPLICGEKGRLYAEVARKADGGPDARIESLEGGTVANAIPREASAVVRCDHMPPADERIDVEALGEGRYRIAATGIGGHASMPEGTCNAIGVLVNYLLDQGICSQAEREFLAFERTLLADSYGRELGIAAEDEVFDPLTCVGGVLRIDGGDEGARFVQTIDIRYPSSTTAARMLARIGEVAERHGCAIVASEDTAPFYIAPDADEIRLLCDTYRRETGRDATPITIGGGTYARHFARAVAFGPDDPAEPAPSWVGQEHGPNEGVAEALLRRALAIYIVAIARLAWR